MRIFIIVYNYGDGAGAKNGIDPGLRYGWQKYTLPSKNIKSHSSNTLILIIENFGLNRQVMGNNDIRNPRGVLAANIKGAKLISWKISGVDIRKLEDCFNTSGFSDENLELPMIQPEVPGVCQLTIPIIAPVWNIVTFKKPSYLNAVICPLRLHISGTATCYVFINGYLIARYYGNGDGPQRDFFLHDGLLETDNVLKILSYDRELNSSVTIEVKPWMMSNTLGSGNINEHGKALKLFERSLKFSQQ